VTADEDAPVGGARERKRAETRRRVTDAGICLFIERGYEATTVEEIAQAAGISRRTFFHHFKSKDDILLSLQSGMGEMIADAVRNAPADATPLNAVRDALVSVCAAVPADDMIEIDRLMRTSESVQARKQAGYVQHEEALFAALRDRWPEAERAAGLRLVAVLAMGAVRLATDAFAREGGARSMDDLLRQSFAALNRELAG